MRNEIDKTDEEILDAFENTGYGRPDMDDIGFTLATLDGFRESRKNWSDPGRINLDTIDTLSILGAQAVKGQTRQDLWIIDFGTIRAFIR